MSGFKQLLCGLLVDFLNWAANGPALKNIIVGVLLNRDPR